MSAWVPSTLRNAQVASYEPLTFFATGDVPYTEKQVTKLAAQMQNLPPEADFVVHVGDLRDASDSDACDREEYESVADILKLSPVPVFILLGDNDWVDCADPDTAYGYWTDSFLRFESFWDHGFTVTRQEDLEENFAFVHKGSLFMGLNLVGRSFLGENAWEARMESQANWVIQSVREYRKDATPGKERVFLFGHPNPDSKHDGFFDPLRDFIRDELDNSVPFLYLHGNLHEWLYEPDFMNQESFLRIMVSGEAKDPPLKFEIDVNEHSYPSTENAFPYDRDLDHTAEWNTYE